MNLNAMVDLETWGTRPGSAIRSLGAVMFDPYGSSTGEEFYMNVDDQSCVDLGLTRDESTVTWWADPKRKRAQDALLVDPRPVTEVYTMFVLWWKKNRAVYPWSQGSGFDIVLLECVARACNGSLVPWKFWDARDTRTAYDMGGLNPFTVRRAGTHHNALADAKHQSRCVQMAYAKVHGRKL